MPVLTKGKETDRMSPSVFVSLLNVTTLPWGKGGDRHGFEWEVLINKYHITSIMKV